jgi:hypothetical protein
MMVADGLQFVFQYEGMPGSGHLSIAQLSPQ